MVGISSDVRLVKLILSQYPRTIWIVDAHHEGKRFVVRRREIDCVFGTGSSGSKSLQLGLTSRRDSCETVCRCTDLNQAEDFFSARFFASSGPAMSEI